MSSLQPMTRLWFALCTVVGGGGVALSLRATPPSARDWLALLVFGLLAAIAHRYPISGPSDTSYRLTNAFLLAGALTLPGALIAPLVLIAITPDTVLRQRGRAIAGRLFVNLPPTVVATLAAHAWVDSVGLAHLHTARDAANAAAAGIILTLLQNGLVGIGRALQFRLPLRGLEMFSRSILLADGFFALMGIIIAGLWRSEPILLAFGLPLLAAAHWVMRTAHLATQAQVDSKTGLHNARHFERALAEEVARSRRLGRPLSVLFADLDHFKRVNDRHGHTAGDAVLQEFATIFATTLRSGDTVARFGGEEFVALLPGTEPTEALSLAGRLRAAVEAHSFSLPGGGTLRCTISIGVATCPEDATTEEALLAEADRAMYRAKQTRNAVARVGTPPTVPRLEAPVAAPAPTPPPPPNTGIYARAIVWGTVALGCGGLAWGLIATLRDGGWLLMLPLLVLAIGAESLAVQFYEDRTQRMTLTFTIAVVMASVAIVPAGAPLIAAAAALVHVVGKRQWQRGLDRALFNLASPALAAAVASACYLVLYRPDVGWVILPVLALATLSQYVVNIGLLALVVSAHTGRPVVGIARDSLWSAPTTLLLGLTGGFLGAAYGDLGVTGTVIYALPLLVMRFTLNYAARKNRQALDTLEAAKGEVEGAHTEKEQTLRQLIATVAAIIDARDHAVAGHSDRVAKYAVALGEELGFSERDLAYLHTAGLLHDLGKVAVPEAILHKPAKLTAEEFAIVKEHAATGERILAEVLPLSEVARMVGDHHERWDGEGYPNREAGRMITRGGRILAVADTLDSILSDRPYSKGKPFAWALEEMQRCAGAHFDPQVVAALERLAATREPAFFGQGVRDSAVRFTTPILSPPAHTTEQRHPITVGDRRAVAQPQRG